MLPKLFLILIFVLPHVTMAKGKLDSKVSLKLGMSSHSFTQLESAFPDQATQSGSSSVIVMNAEYENFMEIDKSFFVSGQFSGLGGEVEKNYSIIAGMKYYFSKYGTKARLSDENLDLDILPSTTYYAGWAVGGTNNVYQVEEAVRSDIGVLYGGVAGASMKFDKKTNYTAELQILKGTGIETDFLDTQILFGVTYFVESFF